MNPWGQRYTQSDKYFSCSITDRNRCHNIPKACPHYFVRKYFGHNQKRRNTFSYKFNLRVLSLNCGVIDVSPPSGGDKHSPADGCGRGVFVIRLVCVD